MARARGARPRGGGPRGVVRRLPGGHRVGRPLVDLVDPRAGHRPRGSGPGCASRRASTSASSATGRATRPRRSSHTADGVPIKGVAPDNQVVPLFRVAEGGESVDLLLEAAANPDILADDFRPTQLGDVLTADPAPLYTMKAAELVVLDEDVWQLAVDLEVLDELMLQLPESQPRRWQIARAIDAALDALDPRDVSGTAAAAREQLVPVLTAPAVPSAPTGCPRRPRAHRLGVAVAAARDPPQDGPHLLQRHGPGEGVPRVRLRLLVGAAVRLGRGAPPARLRPDPRGDRRGPVGAGRRHVGRGRRQPAGRRGDGPPARRGPGVLHVPLRRAVPRRLAARLLRYTGAYPQLARLAGMEWFPHPEDLVEPDQPLPASHLLVGGDRRHPDLHALPAGRHLQRDLLRRGDGARGGQLPRQGPRQLLAGALRPR